MAAAPGRSAMHLRCCWRAAIAPASTWVITGSAKNTTRGVWDGRQLTTRGGERVNAPDWFTQGWPATPMDGELWAGRGAFEHAQSTIGRAQAGDDAWRRMRFMVFDLPAHPGHFDERLAALRSTVAAIGQPWVVAVPQRKVKLHDDAEARVVGHLPGTGRHAGRLGALLVETPQGQRFRLGTGLTDAQREQPPPLGSWVTYRYRGLHAGSGLPRFASFVRVRSDEPRFRDMR
jgi:DNA ligase-1